MNYYPVMLNLESRKAMVIGGGEVALRKVKELLHCNAVVTVISPEFHNDIQELAKAGEITLVHREYRRGDLAGAVLVYSATDNSNVNRQVYTEAEDLNIFINAVDDPPNCSFIVPSVIRRGDLVVSVSTSGASPAMAGRIRRELEKEISSDTEVFLEQLKKVRALLKENNNNSSLTSPQRGEVLKKIVYTDHLLTEIVKAEGNQELQVIIDRVWKQISAE